MIRLFVDRNKIHILFRIPHLPLTTILLRLFDRFTIKFIIAVIKNTRGSIVGQKSGVSLQMGGGQKKNTKKTNNLHSHCIRNRYFSVSSTYIFSIRMLENLPFASGIPEIAVRYRNVVEARVHAYFTCFARRARDG